MIMNRIRVGKGYAFALYLTVLVVLTSLVGWTFISVNNDIATSQAYKMKNDSRAIGQDALSRFYSAFTEEIPKLNAGPEPVSAFRKAAIIETYNDPAKNATITAVDIEGGSLPPLRHLSEVSEPQLVEQTCDPTKEDICVRLTTNSIFTSGPGSNLLDSKGRLKEGLYPAAQPQVMDVTVEVFGQCSNLEGQNAASIVLDVTNCSIIGAYTQKLVPSQIYEYAFYNDLVTLDKKLTPLEFQASECFSEYASGREEKGKDCLEIAYQSEKDTPTEKDIIDGPIFTNDDYVVTCNAPLFKGPVFANPRGEVPDIAKDQSSSAVGRFFKRLQTDGCLTDVPKEEIFTGNVNPGPPLRIETSPVQSASLPEPGEYERLLKAAGAQEITVPAGKEFLLKASSSGKTNYVFAEAGSDSGVGGSINSPIILVNKEPVKIRGVFAGGVSIFSNGELTITDDLISQETSLNQSLKKDVLVLVSASGLGVEQIKVKAGTFNPNEPFPASLPEESERSVEAILVSLTGSVSLSANPNNALFSQPEWTVPRWIVGKSPKLNFTGAIAAKHQGLFGGYDTVGGALNTGFRKNFKFDTRLSEGQVDAPFLPGLITANWSRVNFAEVPQGN